MKNLVRFALALNWGIVIFTGYHMWTEKFIWSVFPMMIAFFHIYILAHNKFTEDALSYYLRKQARSARHSFHKSRRRSKLSSE